MQCSMLVTLGRKLLYNLHNVEWCLSFKVQNIFTNMEYRIQCHAIPLCSLYGVFSFTRWDMSQCVWGRLKSYYHNPTKRKGRWKNGLLEMPLSAQIHFSQLCSIASNPLPCLMNAK
jgi:hypothetical protein